MLLCDVFHGRSSTSYQEFVCFFSQRSDKFIWRTLYKNIFDRDLGKTLSDAYDKRLIEDYGIGFILTEEEARDMLESAKNFVQRLKSYLKRWMEGKK